MIHRTWGALAAISALLVGACGRPGSGAEASVGATELLTDIPRTADPYRRGFVVEDFPRVQEIADGVYTYEQLRSKGPEWEEWFTSVSLFVVTSEGVLVADGQGTPEETARLLTTIAQVTDQPVTHVVMGSAFADHTGGNVVFPETVELFAHPVSDRLLRSRETGSGEARLLLPTQVIDDRTVMRLGEREIHVLNLGLAHVAGDLSVYLPDEKLLFMSEAYLYRIFPALGSAHPYGWLKLIEKAQALDVETYIPGHGFVESSVILAEELETYGEALAQVIAEVEGLHASGIPLDQALTEASFEPLEDWTLAEGQRGDAVRRIYQILDEEGASGR